MDEGEVALGVLVEAGEDAPEVLEPADEALDQVALLVRGEVAGARRDPALLGRDGGHGLHLLLDVGDRLVRVVAAVGQHLVRLDPGQQRDGLRVVPRRATGQEELQRVAESVCEDVDLGAEATPRAPERLRRLPAVFWGAPAAQACARTTVASMSTACRSGSSATPANSRPQTPRSSQRAKRLYTLFHSPYSAGRKRHWPPPRATQKTPSRNARTFSRSRVWILGSCRSSPYTRSNCSARMNGSIGPPPLVWSPRATSAAGGYKNLVNRARPGREGGQRDRASVRQPRPAVLPCMRPTLTPLTVEDKGGAEIPGAKIGRTRFAAVQTVR